MAIIMVALMGISLKVIGVFTIAYPRPNWTVMSAGAKREILESLTG
jgi:hypothetical protein